MTGKLHYVHQKDDTDYGIRCTMAIEEPTKDDLIDFVVENLETGLEDFLIWMGVARVHPDDQYSKATGRVIAKNKSDYIPFKFAGVRSLNGKTYYAFYAMTPCDEDDHYQRNINVIFSTVPHSTHVKVENAFVV